MWLTKWNVAAHVHVCIFDTSLPNGTRQKLDVLLVCSFMTIIICIRQKINNSTVKYRQSAPPWFYSQEKENRMAECNEVCTMWEPCVLRAHLAGFWVELVSVRRYRLTATCGICVQGSRRMTYRQQTTSTIRPRKDEMVGRSGGTLQYMW